LWPYSSGCGRGEELNDMPGRNDGFGRHLRDWRGRRRLSQLELSLRSNVSARHLGFVEIGRAAPSRSLVLRLAEELDVPLRERNVWLVAAGFAPSFADRALDDPSLDAVRSAIDATIEAHKPFPAFAIDRRWNIVASNAALPELYEGVLPELLKRPVNVLRLTLHPGGLAPRLLNLDEWADHLLARLRRELELTADPRLEALLREAETLHKPASRARRSEPADSHALAIPFRIQTRLGPLSFFSTVTVFGTPVDVTVSEIALEMLYPADPETNARVRFRG
jgi:transcriptional regulator with XRE-family HTH domain